MQKERLRLTREKSRQDIDERYHNGYQTVYRDADEYSDKNLRPIENIRDERIKAALRKSIFKVLTQEQNDGSELLKAYINTGETWDQYKYSVERCYIWCGRATSYAPYHELMEWLDEELDYLLFQITDKAWSWITHISRNNSFFC